MIMMNAGNLYRTYSLARLPNQGVGQAWLELIINRIIGVHPRGLLVFD